MANAIGIDFGTTKTMVSYLDPATGRAALVRLGRGRDYIPTTVHVDESGEFLFGEDADDQIETDRDGYCRAFKLRLGEEDPVLRELTAEALTTRFLRHVKNMCETDVFHGEPVDTATLTIPVSFSPARKEALKRAAKAAGFSSVAFLPEPEAAGTAFLRDNPSDKFSRALVLDWGGGTLDIAVIVRDEEGQLHADRRCAAGNDEIGGEEMDKVLLDTLGALWQSRFGTKLIDSDEKAPKLLREAEKTKRELSQKDTTAFRQGPKKVEIARGRFNQLVEPFIQEAADLVRDALRKNEAKGEKKPDAILLIGGTCKIPAIRETMEKEFPGIRVLSWHHSHEAVALGATRTESNEAPPRTKKTSKKPAPRTKLPVQPTANDGEERGSSRTDKRKARPTAATGSKTPAAKRGTPAARTVDSEAFGDALARAMGMLEEFALSRLDKATADLVANGAEEGNASAAGILAEIYHSGCDGYRKNLRKSFQWASVAADRGAAIGAHLLSYYYWLSDNEDGEKRDSPVRQDLSKALEWAEKARAANGNCQNTVWLMVVLDAFDNPDERRIQTLGDGLLKKSRNKSPGQCNPGERFWMGHACHILADIADENFVRADGNAAEQEKYRNRNLEYLQRGSDFGNESCSEDLRNLTAAIAETEEMEEGDSFGGRATVPLFDELPTTVTPLLDGILGLGAGIGSAVHRGVKKWLKRGW